MYFVDVILPLAVPNTFTYLVPKEFTEQVEVGKRAIVQFGRSRFYTALIAKVHQQEPELYQAKELQDVVDQTPIVMLSQLKLWKWMASYYQCHLGEVMNAALPSAYKLVSESKVLLSGEKVNYEELNDKEYLLIEALEVQGVLSISEINKILGTSKIHAVIKSLLDKGVIDLEEELKERYKPLIKPYLRLNSTIVSNEEQLLETFGALKNASKQEDALMQFSAAKGFNFQDFALEKAAFIKSNQLSASAVKGLLDKNIFVLENREIGRIDEEVAGELEVHLNDEQHQVRQKIQQSFKQNKTVLLNGVTGSGKTEVYISLIEQQLELGKKVLYLLPEIALTSQLIKRLKLVFGDKVGVYHSKFNTNERIEVWGELLKMDGRFDIIIGARSAVFLPFNNLGLVIVDEEHEASFKQQDPAPRYNGRDVAIYMANVHGANCLLGTATPSIESFHNVKTDKYDYAELKNRYSGTVLPEVLCADVKEERRKKKMHGIFSELLKNEIEKTLENKEQVILFQNRRGFAPILECNTCGNSEKCDRCDVSLTYHKGAKHLRCHYCGTTKNVELSCSSCGSIETKFKGFGTEMITEEFSKLFPQAKVARMDHDTTRGKYAYQEIIQKFSDQEVDVLVGTQMLTKGLDFGKVALVGVLNADQLLNFPDFRAFERAYQLLTQVSGRAGRREKRGKVVIQTYTPYHAVIRNVMENNYLELYNTEILTRKNFNYPPFFKLINITLKHQNRELLDACAHGFTAALQQALGQERVLGPEYPSVSRVNKFYQKNTLIKFEKNASGQSVKNIVQQWINRYKKDKSFQSVRFNVDVDPY